MAQIALGTEVDDVADLFARAFVKGFHFGNIVGDQIHVLHGQHRQFDADHAAYLARPKATGIDHMLALNHAFVGDDAPSAIGLLFQAFHLGLHFDGGAA